MKFSRGGLAVIGISALVASACSADSKRTDSNHEDSGGTSSTGGASGTSGSAGTAGTAGAGAMRGYHPPDRQIQGCTQMCELEGAASCPAETTTEKCVDDCNVGLLFEDCSSLWDALFACAGSVSPAVCASNGQAVIADCAEESNAAIGCVLNEVTGGQWTTPCEVSCRTVSVELCPNTGSEDDCIFDCQVIGSAFSVCADAYGAALECTTGAELACDAEGKQYAPACAPLVSDFLECVSTEYDWEI